MAKYIHDQADRILAGHHRTGTPPFMAADLLRAIVKQAVKDQPPPPAPPHWLRHDLESLLYILVWAALHYNLAAGTRDKEVHPLVASWVSEDLSANSGAKKDFLTGGSDEEDELVSAVKPEFKSVAEDWILPLRTLFKTALFLGNDRGAEKSNYGGYLTFRKFMKAIGETPRTWGLPESFLDGDA